MRTFNGLFIAAVAATVAAVPAAALTYTVLPGAPDPGVGSGESILVDFDSPLPGGYALSGDYTIGSGTTVSNAAPAGDTTNYLFTPSPPGRGGSATLTTFDLSTLSFYWGSIDSYNFVDVLGAGGTTLLTVGGAQIPPANGNQGSPMTNGRIYFTATGDEVITGIRLRSEGVAFEIDDVAGTLANDGSGSTVPEPTTWAMLIAGFGLTGFAARRRRSVAIVAA